ncbi:hypothetical protein MYX75_08230 [Acidobacteria bacterium AH-259-A15]|nr:hypothetical protein [Acidobacteria bacterium AH-259-A15]
MKEFLQHFWKQIVIAVVSGIIAFAFLGSEDESVFGTTARLVTSCVIAVLCASAVELFKARKAIRELLTAGKRLDAEIKYITVALFFQAVRLHITKLYQQQWVGNWIEVDWDPNLKEFTKLFFKNCRGRYIGTDRHVPTEFYQLYPEYYGSQCVRKVVEGDYRFVLYDAEALLSDYQNNPNVAFTFVDSHIGDGVRLLSVPYDLANQHKTELGLPSTDLGLFGGEFVVFFSPPKLGGKRRRKLKGKIMLKPVDESMADDLEAFLMRLAEHAYRVDLENGVPVLVTRNQEEKEKDIENVKRDKWARLARPT